jgi:hypothetical protein
MLKYISTILSQFTPAQRIIALVLLLFSIVTMSLAPSFISTITLDRNELMSNLENKEARIKTLESNIDTLSEQIRKNQIDCTNRITRREQEFIQMLDDLRNELKNPEIKTSTRYMEIRSSTESKSGVEKNHIIRETPSNEKALQMIYSMKKKLQ